MQYLALDCYGYPVHTCDVQQVGMTQSCQRCHGIETSVMPSDDGIFSYECTVQFNQIYTRVWDELEAYGLVQYVDLSMIDNRDILTITRRVIRRLDNNEPPLTTRQLLIEIENQPMTWTD